MSGDHERDPGEEGARTVLYRPAGERPRSAEFVPPVRARTTGEITVPWDGSRPTDAARVPWRERLAGAFPTAGWRLAAIAVISGLLLALAAAVVAGATRRGPAPPVSPPLGAAALDGGPGGGRSGWRESHDGSATLLLSDAGTASGPTPAEAAAALIAGREDEARRAYEQLAVAYPDGGAFDLAARILAVPPRAGR